MLGGSTGNEDRIQPLDFPWPNSPKWWRFNLWLIYTKHGYTLGQEEAKTIPESSAIRYLTSAARPWQFLGFSVVKFGRSRCSVVTRDCFPSIVPSTLCCRPCQLPNILTTLLSCRQQMQTGLHYENYIIRPRSIQNNHHPHPALSIWCCYCWPSCLVNKLKLQIIITMAIYDEGHRNQFEDFNWNRHSIYLYTYILREPPHHCRQH